MPGPYELYLIRHGVAEERGDAWPDDAKRPLTDEGTDRMRKAARGLARIGVKFDAGVHRVSNEGHVTGRTGTRFVGSVGLTYRFSLAGALP